MMSDLTDERLREMEAAFEFLTTSRVSETHERDLELLAVVRELLALRASPPQEPIEWRYLFRGKGAWKHVYNREAADAMLRENETLPAKKRHVVEPLFAASPSPAPDHSLVFNVIADIREKTGVGAGPMLTELADAVAARCVTSSTANEVLPPELEQLILPVLRERIDAPEIDLVAASIGAADTVYALLRRSQASADEGNGVNDPCWETATDEELAGGPASAPIAGEVVDEIVTRLYRRFKDWSTRGFGPDDVTWCEVRADVAAMCSALSSVPAGNEGDWEGVDEMKCEYCGDYRHSAAEMCRQSGGHSFIDTGRKLYITDHPPSTERDAVEKCARLVDVEIKAATAPPYDRPGNDRLVAVLTVLAHRIRAIAATPPEGGTK